MASTNINGDEDEVRSAISGVSDENDTVSESEQSTSLENEDNALLGSSSNITKDDVTHLDKVETDTHENTDAGLMRSQEYHLWTFFNLVLVNLAIVLIGDGFVLMATGESKPTGEKYSFMFELFYILHALVCYYVTGRQKVKLFLMSILAFSLKFIIVRTDLCTYESPVHYLNNNPVLSIFEKENVLVFSACYITTLLI